MPAAPFWYSDPDSYDRVILGGITLPGVCSVEGLKVASRWDIKEAPGTDGATNTYKGYTPAALTVRVRLWTEEHWSLWQTALAKLRPRPGKATPTAFDITHPATAAWGIRSVIITEIEGPTPGDPLGVMDFTLACREYFAPPKKNTTGTATSSKANGPSTKEKAGEMGRDVGNSTNTDEREKVKPPSREEIPAGAVATENGLVTTDGAKILGDSI